MIVIPFAIVLIVILGCFLDISYGSFDGSFSHSYIYGWGIIKTLIFLEILPVVVVLFSLYLLNRQYSKIKRYRKVNPIEYPFGLLNIFKKRIKSVLTLPHRFFIPLIAYFMLLFWAIGWGLYIYALWTSYSSNSNVAELLGYSAMSSLNLFLLDINGNILDSVGLTIKDVNESLLKGSITITGLCASFCSFFLIIKLFLFKLLSVYHTAHIRITPTKGNHVYVFWGVNDKSIQLAESIKSEDKNRALIIYIEHDTDTDENRDGLDVILNHLASPGSKISSIKLDGNTVYLSATETLENIIESSSIWSELGIEEMEGILQQLDLNKPEALKEEDSLSVINSLHFFFMSADRDVNVLLAKSLYDIMRRKDYQYSKYVDKTIYCCTRRDGVTGIIEDSCSSSEDKLIVKIIDDSKSAIDLLKKDADSHPINFVDIDTTDNYGSVTSPFTGLIVGFGETGRDALRFIYEFGAFADSKSQEPQRSQFKVYVVDEKMDSLKGHFIMNHPYVNSELNIQHNHGTELIEFCDYNDKSQKFYELVKEIAPGLNYVVIAVGDDEANITLAVNVLKMVRRYRADLNHFRIFVRAYENSSFSHLESIAKRYNTTLKSEHADSYDIIKVFGSAKEIYTHEMIVKDKFSSEAEEYFKAYAKEFNKTAVGLQYPLTSWNDRRNDSLSTLKQKLIDDLRRKEFQDRQNALHKLTKISILKTVLLSNLDHNEENKNQVMLSFIEGMFRPDSNGEYRDVSSKEFSVYKGVAERFNFASTLINNLAITEHLRFNASHERLGDSFFEGCEKSTIKMTHNCLVPWNKLPKIFIATEGTIAENANNSKLERLYDYLVVEVSLMQYKNEISGLPEKTNQSIK